MSLAERHQARSIGTYALVVLDAQIAGYGRADGASFCARRSGVRSGNRYCIGAVLSVWSAASLDDVERMTAAKAARPGRQLRHRRLRVPSAAGRTQRARSRRLRAVHHARQPTDRSRLQHLSLEPLRTELPIRTHGRSTERRARTTLRPRVSTHRSARTGCEQVSRVGSL
jgi:hypothetical protein